MALPGRSQSLGGPRAHRAGRGALLLLKPEINGAGGGGGRRIGAVRTRKHLHCFSCPGFLKKSGLVRTTKLNLRSWVHPGREVDMVWDPYKQHMGQLRDLGVSLAEQSTQTRIKEPLLFFPDHFGPEKYFRVWGGSKK